MILSHRQSNQRQQWRRQRKAKCISWGVRLLVCQNLVEVSEVNIVIPRMESLCVSNYRQTDCTLVWKMGKIKGGCLCGDVRYESTAEPLMIVACHCTHCQKQSGSAFSMNIGVPGDSVTVTGESFRTYEDTGASGQPILRKFCGNCGSPILSDVKAAGGLYFIKAGTLDDTSWVTPSAEIWCDSKASWGALDDGLPEMPGNPPLG